MDWLRKIYSLKCPTLLVLTLIFSNVNVYILNIFSVLAVVTVDGEQTHTTTVMKKTLNPYWNESFDLYVVALMIHFLVVY